MPERQTIKLVINRCGQPDRSYVNLLHILDCKNEMMLEFFDVAVTDEETNHEMAVPEFAITPKFRIAISFDIFKTMTEQMSKVLKRRTKQSS